MVRTKNKINMAITHLGFDLDFGAKQVSFPLRLRGIPQIPQGAVLYMGVTSNGNTQLFPVNMSTGQPVVDVTASEGEAVQTTLGYSVNGTQVQWIPNSSRTIQVPVQNAQQGIPQPQIPQPVIPQPQVQGQPGVMPPPLLGPNVLPPAPNVPGQQPGLANPTNALSQQIRGPILSILDAVKKPEKAGGLGALLEMLENRLRQHAEANSIPPGSRDFSAAVTQELHTLILADAGVAKEIKQRLTASGVPRSLRDLQKELILGGKAFRTDVLALLTANNEARKLFGISRAKKLNVDAPFSNPEHNRLFDVACSSHDLGALSKKLNSIIGDIARLPERDTTQQKVQNDLRESVMKRLSPEESETVAKWKPRLINQALQVLGYGALYAGAWWTGAAVLLGRPLLESVSGLTAKDIKIAVKERKILPILEALWKNNIVCRRAYSTATIGEDLKEAGSNILRKVTPLYGPLAHDEDGTIAESTKPTEALAFIRTACQQAAA